MWMKAVGAVLGGIGRSGQEKKAAETKFKNDLKLNEQEGTIGRQNAAFTMELENYYKQQERTEKLRGLDEFRKFSTVAQFAPNYQNTNPNPVTPVVMPQYNAGAYAPAKKY